MKFLLIARLVLGIFLLCSAGEWSLLHAQSRGPERRIRIRFTSAPDRAESSFAFRDQQVGGITTATKVFASQYNFETTVVFTKVGFKNCQKKFNVVWLNEDEGTLTIEGERQQQFNFSAAASPAVVNCDFERLP